MINLIFGNKEYLANKLIKYKDSITAYIGNTEVFSFKGISDFSLFTILDESNNDITLDIFKKSKIEELKESCTNSIFDGFISSNGNHYGFNELDQTNFIQQTIIMLKGFNGTIKWKTKNNGIVEHALEEFTTLINEATVHKLTQQEKYWTLEEKVNNANTIEELELIRW